VKSIEARHLLVKGNEAGHIDVMGTEAGEFTKPKRQYCKAGEAMLPGETVVPRTRVTFKL
jgi:hypothetical protein